MKALETFVALVSALAVAALSIALVLALIAESLPSSPFPG